MIIDYNMQREKRRVSDREEGKEGGPKEEAMSKGGRINKGGSFTEWVERAGLRGGLGRIL